MAAVVIPLQLTKTILNNPPMELPNIPNLPYFGTMAPYAVAIHNSSGNKVDNAKQSAREEISEK